MIRITHFIAILCIWCLEKGSVSGNDVDPSKGPNPVTTPGPLNNTDNYDPYTTKRHYFDTHNQLHHTILSGYNRNLRPAKDMKKPTTVDFQLHITHLEDVNEKQQTLTLNGWFFLKWTDENIAWTTKKGFDQIQNTRLPQFYLWTPDLYLLNNANAKESNIMGWNTYALASRNGTITYDPVTRFTATCDFDFKKWPWDTQNCTLFFGSWTYKSTELTLRTQDFSKKYAIGPVVFWSAIRKHGSTWEIVDAKPKVQEINFPSGMYGNNAAWSYVEVDVILKRNAGHIESFVLVPLVITSCITLVIYWVRGQIKFWMAMLNLLMQFIQMAAIIQIIPPIVSTEPALIQACKLNMVLTFLTLIISIITANISRRSPDRPPPAWVHKIIDSRCIRIVTCSCDSAFDTEYTIQLVDNMEGVDVNVPQGVSERKVSLDWLKVAYIIDYVFFVIFTIAYIFGCFRFLVK